MVSKFALLSNLLFASAALAAPPTQIGAPLAPRRHIDQPTGGAVLNDIYDTHKFINLMGTFQVLTELNNMTPGETRAADIWLGFGGTDCQIFRIGIEILAFGESTGQKTHKYEVWYQPFPDRKIYINKTEFLVNAGDHIMATLSTNSRTATGTAFLHNRTTRKHYQKKLKNRSVSFCNRTAHWMVQPLQNIPFLNFGTTRFTSAVANAGGNPHPPLTLLDASLYNVQRNHVNLTTVTAEGTTILSITRIGPEVA